jgi:hypothetical protein
LGFSLSDVKLTIANLEQVVDKVGKRVGSWQGRFMFSAVWLVITDACLSNLPLFTMGLFLLAYGAHEDFDKHISKFFWEGQENKHKHHMVSSKHICKP